MPFIVKYVQDIPKNCGECPCSVHITPKEVYCNARQKHLEVKDTIPTECGIMECSNPIEPDEIQKSCANCKHGLCNSNSVLNTSLWFCYNDCRDFNLWEAKE